MNPSFCFLDQPLFSKNQYRLDLILISQSVSCAQVTSSAKVYENISENEHKIAQSTEFEKKFDLIKQIQKIIHHAEFSFLNYLTLKF